MKKGEGVLNFNNCGHRGCLTRLTVDEALQAIFKAGPLRKVPKSLEGKES
jgi:hypothetical protein